MEVEDGMLQEINPSEGAEGLEPSTPEDDFNLMNSKPGETIDVTKDGGVKKTIITSGIGYISPEVGDIVEVHYVGTLEDGTQFDSSRDRDEPFTFHLGKDEVIKGWDKGVATMRRGEKATLTCSPDYAYGKSGSPPKIPENATLNFEVELLGWRSVKDMSNDGGVIKTVLKEGIEYDMPSEMDEVTVTYEARVKGADAPFLRKENVEFTVKDGHFCKAVEIAVKRMKKQEKARLNVKPEYGLGEVGQAPEVPPNSELEIEIELLSWKQVTEVTDDGLVMRKMYQRGAGYNKPREMATVTIRYTARLLDGTVFEERGEGNELEFVIDEEQVIQGLDLAVMKMDKGEKAEITIAPSYAFGDQDAQRDKAMVPAGSTVVYDVELVDLTNPPNTWDMSPEEKIEDAKMKKEKGNEAYKLGKLARAIKMYEAATRSIANDDEFGEFKKDSKDLKKSLWLNLAAVQLKQKDYKSVVDNCGKVLGVDPNNVKALYRRAQAYMATTDYLEAEMDLKKAREAEPDNKDLAVMSARMRKQLKAATRKEAQMYSTMFSKLAKLKDADVEGHPVASKAKDASGATPGPSEPGPSGSGSEPVEA